MIAKIIKFELQSRLFGRTSILFFLMLVFQGIWYTKGTYDYYANDAVLMNGASIFYRNFAGGGMIMVIMVAIVTGTALYKDLQHKTGYWLFTYPIPEKAFFLGRFISGYLLNVLIATGYFFGMLLVPYVGLGPDSVFGDAPIGQMIHGFIIFSLPNLFLLTSVVLASVVIFKRLAAGYVFVMLIVVLFIVMESVSGTNFNPILFLVDPFGFLLASEIGKTMTALEKNTAYLEMTDYFLLNRFVWLSISTALFVVAYRKFSFKYFINKNQKQTSLPNQVTSQTTSKTTSKTTQPYAFIPSLSFSTKAYLQKLINLSILEFKNIVRPWGFKIVLGIILLMVLLQNLLFNATYYIGAQVAVTSNFTLCRLTFGVFIIMIVMLWAGELFFKDKTVKIWQIMDALPVPVWVTQLSRFIAISGVSLIFSVFFILIGIVTQTIQGGADAIDLKLYVYDLLGYNWGWLTYLLHIALVFFIAGITGNRFITHLVSIGYFIGNIIFFDMGIAEELRFGYALVPGLEDYSNVIGYGIFETSAFWYFVMWASLAIIFILLGIQFWGRGAVTSFRHRFNFASSQLNVSGKIVMVILVGIFAYLQYFIYENVNQKNHFELEVQANASDAEYERKYGYLQTVTQPKYDDLQLQIDLFPEQNKAVYKAKIQLENASLKTIDTLFLNFKDFLEIKKISLNNKVVEPIWANEEQLIWAYLFPSKLDSNTVAILEIEAEKQYEGFPQSPDDMALDLIANGSFGSLREFLPVIGFDTDKMLKENRKRAEQGLEKLSSRIPKVADKIHSKSDIYAPDANWITGKVIISTNSQQVAISAGNLTKKWKVNGRNYFEYQVRQKSPFDWYLGSSELTISAQNTPFGKVEIWHHTAHNYNIAYYHEIMGKALKFVSQNLGKYPFSEVRLVEIPFYYDDAYAFPNVIALNEKQGWLADTSAIDEKAYLHQSIAAEACKHWFQQNLQIANVQGADMWQTALPEALALQFVKEQLGEQAVRTLITKKQTVYNRERHNDSNGEPPLLYSDSPDYLAKSKGAIAFYDIIQTVGFQEFLQNFLTWQKNHQNNWVQFVDFYHSLLNLSTSKAERQKIETEFNFSEKESTPQNN